MNVNECRWFGRQRAVEYRFMDITEDLTVFVFVAPSAGSRKDGTDK
jgi:hypothetical protein